MSTTGLDSTKKMLTVSNSEFSKKIQEETESHKKEWKYGKTGDAFACWAAELLYDLDPDDAFDATYIGKVGGEHGLDGLEESEGVLYLMQSKCKEDFQPGSFGEDVVVQFLNCLKWLKEPNLYPFAEGNQFQLASRKYRDAVEKGKRVEMTLVILGDLTETGNVYLKSQMESIIATHPNHTLSLVNFSTLKDLYFERISLEEEFNETVTITVKKDETFEREDKELGIRARVVSVPALELVRMYDTYKRKLFLYNVRFYLDRTSVNTQIEKTLSTKEKVKFWHLNNGLSIICSDYGWVGNEKTKLFLVGPQVVNGCQTVATLARCESKGLGNVDVLARIIKINKDSELSLQITQATNTQNPNYNRDLASNLPAQVRLQGLFAKLEEPYFYERKRKEFKYLDASKRKPFYDELTKVHRVVDNDKVANSYLSFALQNPTDARTNARLLFDLLEPYYDQIFSGERTAEEYLLPVLILRQIEIYLKKFRKEKNAFEDMWLEKNKLGKKLTEQEESRKNYFDDMEALPYAKTQLTGLVHQIILKKYGKYDAQVARRLLPLFRTNIELMDELVDFCVRVVKDYTKRVKEKELRIDADNDYKLVKTYTGLVKELTGKLEDPYYKTPLDKLP